MTDEVGPNDPNRGRSSAGGFKMPFSKPIAVRDVDDVYDAAWGGMRKPKQRDDRRSAAAPSLAGGGYTSAQTNNERGRIMFLFLGLPIVLIALLGFVGWLSGRTVDAIEPLETTCGSEGFEAVFLRSDFAKASAAGIRVTYTTDQRPWFDSTRIDISEFTADRFTISVPPPGVGVVQGCTLEEISAFR